MTAPDGLLTVNEVAAETGERLDDLLVWRLHGQGPRSFRLGDHIYYRRSDVKAWLDQRKGGAA